MGKTCGRVFAHQAVYRYLVELIEQPRPCGDQRLPSLRDLAQRLDVSLSTVQHAYARLEHEGRIRSVPRSGYYVNRSVGPLRAGPLGRLPSDLPLPDLPALEHALLAEERRLARQLARAGGDQRLAGDVMLRNALAARYTRASRHCWSAGDVCLATDLQALLETVFAVLGFAGATVLVASPCSWRWLRLLQCAGGKLIEMPLDPHGRADLQALAQLLASEPVRLASLPSCLAAPPGRRVPAQEQLAVATLLERHGIWLLENDLDSEHCFEEPPEARLRDAVDPGRLLVLGSLEAYAGAEMPYAYLLGQQADLHAAMALRDFRLPPLRQQALARLLAKGQVDGHLRRLREELAARAAILGAQLIDRFGGALAFEAPEGGRGLWVRLAHAVDAQRILALPPVAGLRMIPGECFSLQGRYREHLSLAWEGGDLEQLRRALARLAEILARCGPGDR